MQVSEELRQQVQRIIALAQEKGSFDHLSDDDRARIGAALKTSYKHVKVPRLKQLFPDEGPLSYHNYPKHMEHFRAGKRYKARMFRAGNRVGKTIGGAYEGSCHGIGWYPHWWDGFVVGHPAKVVVAAKTAEKLKEVPQEYLFGEAVRDDKGKFRLTGDGLIPANAIMHQTAIFRPSAPGTLKEIGVRYKDSQLEWSTFKMVSYEQGRAVFESSAYDFVWLDEESDVEIFSEAFTRMMTTKGRMVLTMSPLDGLTELVMQFLPKEYQPPRHPEIPVEDLLTPPPPGSLSL